MTVADADLHRMLARLERDDPVRVAVQLAVDRNEPALTVAVAEMILDKIREERGWIGPNARPAPS